LDMGTIANLLRPGNVDFAAVNQVALVHLPSLVRTWLPNGRRRGNEWVSLNPRRNDKHQGSFSVNLRTGKWADFAVGDKGGDPISLAAYIFNTSQADAARTLAITLGVTA
jgi:hypothetical protein